MDIIKKLKEYEKGHTIIFDNVLHAYTINGNLFAGVSSIVDELEKPFLKQWAANEAVKALGYYDDDSFASKYRLETILNQIKNMDVSEYYSLLESAKNAHAKKSNKAKNSGKIAHEWIESHISGENPEMPKDPEALTAIESFISWEKLYKPKWLLSEKLVVSFRHEFAGTLDALAMIDGKLMLIDFKTSNQISDSYALQTAGYQICLEEAGINPVGRIILRIPKNNSPIEYCEVGTDIEFDKRTFLHLRECRRWRSYIENNFMVKVGKFNKIKLDK